MDELRWILVLIGVAMLGAIYYFGQPRGDQSTRKRRKTPVFLNDSDPSNPANDPPLTIDDPIEEAPEEPQSPSVNRDPDSIVALFLRPRGPMSRADVFRAAAEAGLDFGELEIFHRTHEGDDGRVAVYSLANIAEPGGFGSDASDGAEVPGLCLFMTLPNPLSALDAWEAMLATARRLGDLLHCEVQDESRSTLTRQCAASLREEMRAYDRKRNLFG